MHRITVPLSDDARAALFRLASLELREPRWQATAILEDGLPRAAVLANERAAGHPEPELTAAASHGPGESV